MWHFSAVAAHVARLLLLLSEGALLHCYAFQQDAGVGREAHESHNALHIANSLSLVKTAYIWYSVQMAVTST